MIFSYGKQSAFLSVNRFISIHLTQYFISFPAETIAKALQDYKASLSNQADQSAFEVLTGPLEATVAVYTKSQLPGVPGSERAFQFFLSILRKWIAVERWFCDGKAYADAVDAIRKSHKAEPVLALEACRSHEQLKMTSVIVRGIISSIGEGSRVDMESSTASAMGKRVSAVSGATGLPDAMPSIAEIASMGLAEEYFETALCAKKLLMQESMPSFEQRRQKVLAAARALSSSVEEPSREAEDFLAQHIPLVDLFFDLITGCDSSAEQLGLMELYQRHLYRMYTLKSLERDPTKKIIKYAFLNKASESAVNPGTSMTSMADLTRAISSGSLSKMSESSANSGSEKHTHSGQDKEKISQNTLRTGVSAIIEKFDDLSNMADLETILASFPQFTGAAVPAETAPVNVLYFVVLDTIVGQQDAMNDIVAQRCQSVLAPIKDLLKKADIRRVSFVFAHAAQDEFEGGAPALFTYRFPEFQEDSLYRNIDPSNSMHLDLNRVAANFHVNSLGSRHTSTCHIHLYKGTPKSAALEKDKKAKKDPRIFARALSFVLEFSAPSFERILVDALNAFDLCSAQSKSDNHLFLNLVSDFEKAVLDPVVVEETVVAILKRHSDRVSTLGIVEVETRIVCCLSKDSPPIAIRLFASNPTGYVHVMNTYVEAANEHGVGLVFKLIGGTKASLASAGDSSWDGLDVNTPYPLTRLFDAQRYSALKASDTLYCYDLPALFEAAVEEQWLEASKKGGVGMRGAGRPLMVMYTTELVVKKQDGSVNENWTMDDYHAGDLELIQMNRRAGTNDVGMVAWLLVLKTVEYPEVRTLLLKQFYLRISNRWLTYSFQGRQVVLIANDITYKAGSFGTREDVVFKMASEYARENRIPRLFVAANSGARIGLAERIRKCFQVAFKDPSRPESGFDFLYVTKEDYAALTTQGVKELRAEPATVDGKDVFKITDIIGSEPDLGVENLKGSGLIAGETSIAYDDIFTMTIVLGRTVGIGAYLVRLGQRTIQKYSASPIILTGYQALNKLMGVDVYSTNDQLGGPGIMYLNGVSHLVANDHLQAVKSAIDWLSFVPSVRGGLLPISDIRGVDDIERPIGFTPSPGVPYDPRCLLAGGEDAEGNWQSGFFDKGSFTETLAGWAKTVVVGRARLGGIPMGVVITENRTAENVKPADPADVAASEAVIQEAGCVWFPNSAYKTAQAIKDFKTEDLPLIVFANWRGFSGGQRDMFDEVLKYGSLIVDAFVAYTQPVFVFIPPFAEIRGGAWVVLDASINASVMEMYAAKGTARGGVLEANGAASVKYRSKDLILTMHRLDETLKMLDTKLKSAFDAEKAGIKEEIMARERMLLPVYEQIAVQFCELHDTPGRMQAVGVIEREVEWSEARCFFYWRLRRKLAEFDLRQKIIEAGEVGRGVKSLEPLQATSVMKQWFVESPNMKEEMWNEDKVFLAWMAQNNAFLEQKIVEFTKEVVIQEVVQVMTAGGNTARVGTTGIVEGLGRAMSLMSAEDRQNVKHMLTQLIN
jgi:acetyl-CoA carboxylase/biotin carboxylase 1